jgi:hypothetical protein
LNVKLFAIPASAHPRASRAKDIAGRWVVLVNLVNDREKQHISVLLGYTVLYVRHIENIFHEYKDHNVDFIIDSPAQYYYSVSMRWQAVIVLLAIMLSIIVPPSLPMTISHDGQTSIATLDLCHSSAPALATSGNMPCTIECPCQPLPLARSAAAEIDKPPFRPFLIAFQDERPPKA